MRTPKNPVDTQFSIRWVLACAVVDRKVSLRHFTEAALRDGRYMELAGKVEVDPDDDREGVWVKIKLKASCGRKQY
ncbi:MAG: MmgE/PrpD family protein [Chloroflexi bacterium]|nr:MmgE/PrpD family protein [Chloroflexota bacterium]